VTDVPVSAAPGAAAWRVFRTGTVGLAAGLAAGAVVGGLGGRVVMRLLFLANEETAGGITANGNKVGVFTLGGTLGLILFVALFMGVPAGMLYVVIRRWLGPTTVARGLVYGALLLVLTGSGASIDPDNFDFNLFGPAGLAVALFGMLPFGFGLAVAALADRWGPYVPDLFRRRIATIVGYLLLTAAFVVGSVGFARSVSELV
jgi:hypothetical protein